MKTIFLLLALVLASFSAEASEHLRPKLEKAEFTYASGDRVVLTIKDRNPVTLELFTSTGKHCVVPPEKLKGIKLSLLGSVQISETLNIGTDLESTSVGILGYPDSEVIYKTGELTVFYFLFVNGTLFGEPHIHCRGQSKADKLNQLIIENSKDEIKEFTEPEVGLYGENAQVSTSTVMRTESHP